MLAALRAIEAGDASEENVTAVGSDRDVEERTRAQLDGLGPRRIVAGKLKRGFLAGIGIGTWLRLAAGRLPETAAPELSGG